MKSYYVVKSTMPAVFGGCKYLDDIVDVAQNIVAMDAYNGCYLEIGDKLVLNFTHPIPDLNGVWVLEEVEA